MREAALLSQFFEYKRRRQRTLAMMTGIRAIYQEAVLIQSFHTLFV